MMYKLKDIDFPTLKSKLDLLLLTKFKLEPDKEVLKQTGGEIKIWNDEINNLLKHSILPNAHFFQELIDQHDTSIYDSFTLNIRFNDPIMRELKTHEKKIELIKNNLNQIVGYLKIINQVTGDMLPDVITTQEKLDFVLEKLYLLKGDLFYSVEKILTLNEILQGKEEASEIAQLLTKKGYTVKKEIYLDNDDRIKITVKGSAYVERKLKSKSSKGKNKNKILDQKIDEILERLTKLGYGQQIIFEEIEEMRELQNKLTKKSWGQLLKGKLIDLTISEMISKETASDVYQFLTDQGMKLLK